MTSFQLSIMTAISSMDKWHKLKKILRPSTINGIIEECLDYLSYQNDPLVEEMLNEMKDLYAVYHGPWKPNCWFSTYDDGLTIP